MIRKYFIVSSHNGKNQMQSYTIYYWITEIDKCRKVKQPCNTIKHFIS